MMVARRLTLAIVVWLCSLGGGLLLSPAALAVTPPMVEEAAVLEVAGTSATFQATINPQGTETTYRFEYGTSEAYGSQIPVPDGLVGSGLAGVTVSAHPQDLQPSTTYHYRVVALVASRSETVPGSDGTFTTQPAGGEFALPDQRRWELVSPPDLHGAGIEPLSGEVVTQASEDGSGLTYSTNTPTELEPPGYTYEEQVLSTRGPQGWFSRDISPPHAVATGTSGAHDFELSSNDLSAALVDPFGGVGAGIESVPLLSSQASEPTPYIRREGLCDSVLTASECYQPLLTGKEGYADVPPSTKFFEIGNRLSIFNGASPDLSHVVLTSRGNVALTATPITTEEGYEWSAGRSSMEALQLVTVLPESEGGHPVGSDLTAQEEVLFGTSPGPWSSNRHSISNDGSRVFWGTQHAANRERRVYMRDTARGETVRLDVPQPGASGGGYSYAKFEIASNDGSKAFFIDAAGLTPQSGAGDLYECEIVIVADKSRCDLTDLTPASGGQSAEVHNMLLGAGEDGSYVYFVANGVLGKGATQGANNLYEYHARAITFIATLSAEDSDDWGKGDVEYQGQLGQLTARVSPDGRYVAFMSDESLTSYDNRDANTGRPDMEVYLYDAATRHLMCVSCNPTGARPVGIEVSKFYPNETQTQFGLNLADVVHPENDGYSAETEIAANIPAGNALSIFDESLYQTRVLSDGGRLFFDSSDALVPQDVNAQEDVYEFEPEGTGSCTTSSATFNPKSGGCASLISSGSSPEESGFMDAGKGGSDVFFLTDSQLTPQDQDTSFNIYDAHECSASVPCAALSVVPPPCTSGDSCKAAPSPQPPIFGAPASSTFTGTGNVAVAPSTPGVRSKALTRAQKLAQALKACRNKPKRKRAACERQARKRYATKGALTAARATGKGIR